MKERSCPQVGQDRPPRKGQSSTSHLEEDPIRNNATPSIGKEFFCIHEKRNASGMGLLDVFFATQCCDKRLVLFSLGCGSVSYVHKSIIAKEVRAQCMCNNKDSRLRKWRFTLAPLKLMVISQLVLLSERVWAGWLVVEEEGWTRAETLRWMEENISEG